MSLKLIPRPLTEYILHGSYAPSKSTKISISPDSEELKALADYLASRLQYDVTMGENSANIQLILLDKTDFGEEGYELAISESGVRLSAKRPAGLFYGVQTLLQLMPTIPDGTLSLSAVSIRDIPRFAWRGAMLDVARHFFNVQDV